MTEQEKQRLKELEDLNRSKGLTDEEYSEYETLAKQRNQEDIDAAVDRKLKAIEKENSREKRELGENKAEKSDDSAIVAERVEVGDDLTPSWVKRTAKVLNAGIARSKEEFGKAERLIEEVNQDVAEMNKAQKREEAAHIHKCAKEAAKRSGSMILATESFKQRIQRFSQIAMTRTLQIGTNSEGGFLLPKPFLAELAVIMEERGVARSVCRGIPMSNDKLDLKSIATKPVASWVDEEGLIGVSDAAFAEGSLDAKKLGAVTSWTSELDEDSAFAFIPVITELFGESMLTKEDDAAFAGTGAAATGGFTGMLNLSGAGVVTMGTGDTTFSDLTADYLKSLRDELSLAKRRGAAYMMHPEILSIVEGLKDTQGNYIYRKPSDATGPGTLWGYPIVLTESLPSSADTAVSTKFVVFGDPIYYLFGTRRSITAQTTTEGIISDGSNNVVFNAFQQDGAIIKLTERVGLKAQLESPFAVLRTAAT